MASQAAKHEDREEKLDRVLQLVKERILTIQSGGRFGHVTVVIEAGRVTFVDMHEREKIDR